jgi:hypothetical protein
MTYYWSFSKNNTTDVPSKTGTANLPMNQQEIFAENETLDQLSSLS